MPPLTPRNERTEKCAQHTKVRELRTPVQIGAVAHLWNCRSVFRIAVLLANVRVPG